MSFPLPSWARNAIEKKPARTNSRVEIRPVYCLIFFSFLVRTQKHAALPVAGITGRPSSVNRNDNSRDVRRIGRSKEKRCACYLFRIRGTTQRNVAQKTFGELLILVVVKESAGASG